MTEREVSAAIVAWALDTAPQLQSGYAYPVASKLGPLPDVAAVVQAVRVTQSAPGSGKLGLLQAAWLKLFVVECSVMVEPGEQEELDAQIAHETLQDIVAALMASALDDDTLSGRVPMVSAELDADYSTPFVEYADGTRGRLGVLTLTVIEPIEEPG